MKEIEKKSVEGDLNSAAEDQNVEPASELKRAFVPPRLVKHGGLTELTGMPATFSP